MELNGHEVLPSGRRTEARPVVRLADEISLLFGHGEVGVDEVERLTVEAFKNGVIPHHRQIVPADVRDLEPISPKAHHFPRQEPEPLHTRRLLGALEDYLQGDADPEKGFARPERLPARPVHTAFPQLPHAISESPYTWQNHSISGVHPLRIGREIHPRTDLLQRPGDGERIARIVVDDRDVQARQHFSTLPAAACQHAPPGFARLRLSARRLALLGGSQHFSQSSRSLTNSVEPTAAGNGASRAPGRGPEREKLTC